MGTSAITTEKRKRSIIYNIFNAIRNVLILTNKYVTDRIQSNLQMIKCITYIRNIKIR